MTIFLTICNTTACHPLAHYRFVKDTLFPYARAQLDDFVKNHLTASQVEDLCQSLAADVEAHGGSSAFTPEMRNQVNALVYYLMNRDIKSAALKDLQGQIWKAGYESGNIQGHVYADAKPMLSWMQTHDVSVYIYSSGSIQAQQLLFEYSVEGNLRPYLSGHFDITTAGNKKQATSYRNIAASLKVDPSEIVFVSDAEAELQAAHEAGIGHAVMSIRPGNARLTKSQNQHQELASATVYSLLQLCGK